MSPRLSCLLSVCHFISRLIPSTESEWHQRYYMCIDYFKTAVALFHLLVNPWEYCRRVDRLWANKEERWRMGGRGRGREGEEGEGNEAIARPHPTIDYWHIDSKSWRIINFSFQSTERLNCIIPLKIQIIYYSPWNVFEIFFEIAFIV